MLKRVVRASFVAAVSLATIAHADGMRCGDRLVSEGETGGEVLLKCGAPYSADRQAGPRGTIDTWVYNFGPKTFLRILTFRNSRLVTIETGNYGM